VSVHTLTDIFSMPMTRSKSFLAASESPIRR